MPSSQYCALATGLLREMPCTRALRRVTHLSASVAIRVWYSMAASGTSHALTSTVACQAGVLKFSLPGSGPYPLSRLALHHGLWPRITVAVA
jgi:hypothetical protein